MVEKHRVAALVYKRMKRFGNRIPSFVLSRLRKRVENNTRRNVLKAAELAYILKGFNQRCIPALAFKGPVLGLITFGDLGSRHVGDLDLLIPEEHIEHAEAFLHQAGYTRILPDFHLTARQKTFFMRNFSHFGYFCREKRIYLELHYRCVYLSSLFPLRFENAWNGHRIVPIGGVSIPTFSLEHTLMFLCVHGTLHGWSRLFWLTDVAYLVGNESGFDWDQLMDHSNQMGISRMIAEGLILGALLLDCPLPGKVIKYVQRDKVVNYLVRIAWNRIQSLNDHPNIPVSWEYFQKKLYDFSLRSDLNYKLKFFLYQIGPSHDDWETVNLPNYLFSLYFMMKPFSLFYRWRIHHKRDSRNHMPMGRLG